MTKNNIIEILLMTEESQTIIRCKESSKKLIQLIIQELESDKSKEEKIEQVFSLFLDYFNQDVKEDWKKRKIKTQMLLTLTEKEWQETKKEAFKNYIDKEIIKKMKF